MTYTMVSYLRGDSLAQLLTLSSVKAHSRPLVVETCQGLVLGAVAERMGGVYSLHLLHNIIPFRHWTNFAWICKF